MTYSVKKYEPIISIRPDGNDETISIYKVIFIYKNIDLKNKNELEFYITPEEYLSFKENIIKFFEWDNIAKENKVNVSRRELPWSLNRETPLDGDMASFYGGDEKKVGWANHGSINFYFNSTGYNSTLQISPNMYIHGSGIYSANFSPSSLTLTLTEEQAKDFLDNNTDEILNNVYQKNLTAKRQQQEYKQKQKEEKMIQQEKEDKLFK
ncbi:hypothetical protein LQZ19_17330 [Treponema primitia]|uniref:hypothetical protein n=1 Tax=Treponema primitia TaxID=88058 RepID=UPI0039811DA8